MKSLINKIIEIDTKAEQKINEAKQRKEIEIEKINKEIEELKKTLHAHAEERIARFKAYEFGNADEHIAVNAEKNRVQQLRLDETYDKCHSQWEDTLYKRVMEGE